MRNKLIKNIGVYAIIFMFLLLPTTSLAFKVDLNRTKADTSNYQEHEYYSYQDMSDLLQEFKNDYPDIFKLESLGKTYEDRDIWMVKISDNVEIDEDEPGILLLGAHHGDEKISFEILIFYIKHIVENYGKENTDDDDDGLINEDPIDGKDNDGDGEVDEDPSEDRVRTAVNTSQMFLIPMVSPDGVEANSRKNCNPDSRTGVNLNRNYGYDWIYYDLFPGIFGDIWTRDETSWNYRGPEPYSESETQAVKELAETYMINISLSYHSGAEVVFYPWYHTSAKAPHEELFIEIGEDMEEISGYPLYTGSDSPIPSLGGTLGTSENFLYGEHKVIAYTVESARSKAPTNPTSVYNYCYKNVGVHLYLSEKAQTVDNEKTIKSRDIAGSFPNILIRLNKIFNQLFQKF